MILLVECVEVVCLCLREEERMSYTKLQRQFVSASLSAPGAGRIPANYPFRRRPGDYRRAQIMAFFFFFGAHSATRRNYLRAGSTLIDVWRARSSESVRMECCVSCSATVVISQKSRNPKETRKRRRCDGLLYLPGFCRLMSQLDGMTRLHYSPDESSAAGRMIRGRSLRAWWWRLCHSRCRIARDLGACETQVCFSINLTLER